MAKLGDPGQVWRRYARHETRGRRVGGCVGVMKRLVEIIHSQQHLVSDSRPEGGIQNRGIVVHVHRTHLVVVRNEAAERRGLGALTDIPSQREAISIVEAVIDFHQTVVADTGFRASSQNSCSATPVHSVRMTARASFSRLPIPDSPARHTGPSILSPPPGMRAMAGWSGCAAR